MPTSSSSHCCLRPPRHPSLNRLGTFSLSLPATQLSNSSSASGKPSNRPPDPACSVKNDSPRGLGWGIPSAPTLVSRGNYSADQGVGQSSTGRASSSSKLDPGQVLWLFSTHTEFPSCNNLCASSAGTILVSHTHVHCLEKFCMRRFEFAKNDLCKARLRNRETQTLKEVSMETFSGLLWAVEHYLGCLR